VESFNEQGLEISLTGDSKKIVKRLSGKDFVEIPVQGIPPHQNQEDWG
jgi:hypothetical protein